MKSIANLFESLQYQRFLLRLYERSFSEKNERSFSEKMQRPFFFWGGDGWGIKVCKTEAFAMTSK